MTKRKTKHFVAPGERGAYCSASDPIGLTENIAKVSCIKCLKRLLKIPITESPAPLPIPAPEPGLSVFEVFNTGGSIVAVNTDEKLLVTVSNSKVVLWRELPQGGFERARASEVEPDIFCRFSEWWAGELGVEVSSTGDGGSVVRVKADRVSSEEPESTIPPSCVVCGHAKHSGQCGHGNDGIHCACRHSK